jgi:hypothetical protein
MPLRWLHSRCDSGGGLHGKRMTVRKDRISED